MQTQGDHGRFALPPLNSFAFVLSPVHGLWCNRDGNNAKRTAKAQSQTNPVLPASPPSKGGTTCERYGGRKLCGGGSLYLVLELTPDGWTSNEEPAKGAVVADLAWAQVRVGHGAWRVVYSFEFVLV